MPNIDRDDENATRYEMPRPDIDEQIAAINEAVKDAFNYDESDITIPRKDVDAILATLERLRAIENTKGVPGYPTVFNTYLPDDENTLVAIVRGIDYDALRLHAQHLQDRLNRMEALMREPSEEMELAGAPHCKNNLFTAMMVWKAMSAALLAKVEGRE